MKFANQIECVLLFLIFWGATVITNLFSAIPLVGEGIVTWLWGGPMALAAAKKIINEVPRMSDEEAFVWAAQYSDALFDSVEAAEGMSAFLEKRDPDWINATDS